MFFDIVGAFVSLLSTYLFIRLNPKAWLVGIVATCINGYLYWYKGIYADMLLEVFYFLTMCYGWYLWKNKYRVNNNYSITSFDKINSFQWSTLILVLCALFGFIYYILLTFTNSNVVLLDAATTSLSLVAQWLMCHKFIATWMLWFATDALYVFMYFGKDLPFHSVLMIVYTGMAVTGYWVWAKKASLDQKELSIPFSPERRC